MRLFMGHAYPFIDHYETIHGPFMDPFLDHDETIYGPFLNYYETIMRPLMGHV